MNSSPLLGVKDSDAQEFDDIKTLGEKALAFPTRIQIHKGNIIDRVVFINANTTMQHGGSGGTLFTFDLQEEEYLVEVSGGSSCFGSWSTIEYLIFKTSKGRTFNPGNSNSGNNPFSFKVAYGEAIFATFGNADFYVRNIGFYTRKIETKSDGNSGNDSLGKAVGGFGKLKF